MKRTLAMILALAMTLTMVGCGSKEQKPATGASVPAASNAEGKDPYSIGVAVPLTRAGSSAGKMEVVGITMAVNEINEAGGVNGRELSINLVDTAGDPKESANAVRKLTSEHVLAIVGPHYSGEAEVTYPIGDELKVVQVALACSKPGISEGYAFGFRNVAAEDQISAAVLPKWVEDNNIKTVAIITDIKVSVAKSLGEDVYPPIFKELGVEVLTLDDPITYQSGDVDFSAQITKAKALGADGIALGSLAGDALNIIAEAREQGLTQSFVGAAPMLEGELEKKGGEDVQGTYSGSVFCLTSEDPKVKDFIAKYRELAPTMYKEVSADPLHYCANAYDAVYMLAQAIEELDLTGSKETLEADRTAIKDYLAGLKDFEGIDSRGFDETHTGIKDIYVLKIEGDQWVAVE